LSSSVEPRFLPDPLGLAERAAVAEELASVLRHDLRNKFAAVRNAGFYIRKRLENTDAWKADPRLEELSGIIQQEMAMANALLEQQFSVKHLFAPAPAEVDPRQCIQHAIAGARVPPAIRIEVDAAPASVRADPTELALGVCCLLENAAEAMDGSGLVEVRGFANDAHYVIEVADGGPGIPETDGEAVLRPLHSTKEGHAGLGLNIARRIAHRYGGSLSVRHPPAGGLIAITVELCSEESIDGPSSAR